MNNPFEVATILQDLAESPDTTPQDSAIYRSQAHGILTDALGPNAVLTPLSEIDNFVWGLLGSTHRSEL